MSIEKLTSSVNKNPPLFPINRKKQTKRKKRQLNPTSPLKINTNGWLKNCKIKILTSQLTWEFKF